MLSKLRPPILKARAEGANDAESRFCGLLQACNRRCSPSSTPDAVQICRRQKPNLDENVPHTNIIFYGGAVTGHQNRIPIQVELAWMGRPQNRSLGHPPERRECSRGKSFHMVASRRDAPFLKSRRKSRMNANRCRCRTRNGSSFLLALPSGIWLPWCPLRRPGGDGSRLTDCTRARQKTLQGE